MSLDDWRHIEIHFETIANDHGPVLSIASYVIPGTDEWVSFRGMEEHEAIALAKLDIGERFCMVFGCDDND